MAQMAGAHALSWAVGAYLPLSTTFPIWIGGMMKALADKMTPSQGRGESELSSGMLYATGLVAGGSLGGVLIALVAFIGDSVLHMENPTLLEKLDLGQKFYPAFKNGVGGQTSSARSCSPSCACCSSATRGRSSKRKARHSRAKDCELACVRVSDARAGSSMPAPRRREC